MNTIENTNSNPYYKCPECNKLLNGNKNDPFNDFICKHHILYDAIISTLYIWSPSDHAYHHAVIGTFEECCRVYKKLKSFI